MISLVTWRSQSEGIFKKINVFYNLQRKMSVFERVAVVIFLKSKYEQKIILDPSMFILKYWNVSN